LLPRSAVAPHAPSEQRRGVWGRAMQRDKHGRTVADLEKKNGPAAPRADAPFCQTNDHRVATKAGRARYKLRQQTVEPVFGIIKEAMGFRRFPMRGLAKVSLKWTLVVLARAENFHTQVALCIFKEKMPGKLDVSSPGNLASQ